MSQTPEVESNELLARQLHPEGQPKFFDPVRSRPVHQSAFLPSKEDSDGLSLIRLLQRTEAWAAFRPEKAATRYLIARLVANRLHEFAIKASFLSASFEASADELDDRNGEPWAHCVIKEVNRTAYDADTEAKKRIKEWALAVSDSLNEIDVTGPFEEPTDKTPYRPVIAAI